VDLDHLAGLLRKLSPQQEKVIRMYFGLGCERPHSAAERAQEFGVSAPVVAGLVGAAQRRLREAGLTSSHLRRA
jgi:RNA polymerase primary sigma factor